MIDNYVQSPLIVEQIGKFTINTLKYCMFRQRFNSRVRKFGI